MITKYPKKIRSVFVIAVLLLTCFAGFYSCQKNKAPADDPQSELLQPGAHDRFYSVANVFYTADGKSVQAWFYESPQIFSFSVTNPHAKANFDALKYAKENNVPVNVRLSESASDRIDVIIPSTTEQRAGFKADMAKREMATPVPSPEEVAAQGTNNLVGVIPNVATLNTIFNKIKDQCCKSPGPYTYGQCVPFQFVADGCYARAHKMRQIIENFYGYTSYKVFNYACNGSGTLSVSATLWNNNCCVNWWYHVASYVYVQVGSSQVAYLIDPAMFTGPVSISSWVSAQKNAGCGYNGSAQGQVYYTSNAYAPSSLNTGTCTLVPFADNTYTAADATCASYAPKQGCFF
jgi:hypothetical protein